MVSGEQPDGPGLESGMFEEITIMDSLLTGRLSFRSSETDLPAQARSATDSDPQLWNRHREPDDFLSHASEGSTP